MIFQKIKTLFQDRFPLLLVFSLLITSGFDSRSQTEKEILVRLQDENVVVATALELHLTDTDSPMINSTVSLDHEDAWLFFDNVRPSEVVEKYKSGVKINGEAFSPGYNGRIAIYKHGTVIMPHGNTFKPLTVYTEKNFTGESTQLAIHTYHNDLGAFDNAIKSFILKRGYQATFANAADGSEYSRVFIADEADLKINMPLYLENKVSFIRVFKHEWVTKKGWAGWNFDDIKKMNVTCYYDWNVGGTTTENYEYSPIRQNGGWPSWTDINEKRNVSHLLGFNEPDRPDQANMTFDQIIDIWPDMMKSGLRIGSPAWSNPWGGNGGNLFDFINKCEELNYRVDFVALHCYWGGKSPQAWYNDLKYIHEQTGRPLWITEWNNGANWTTEWWPDGRGYNDANAQKQYNDMKGILQVLDTASFVERYFIYNWVEDCRAMILPGGIVSLAGEYYRDSKSAVAYNSKTQVVPRWTYKTPELEMRYFALRNSMRVSWPLTNGELVKTYIVERKIDDGAFEAIFSSEDPSVDFYLDPLDQELYGKVTYRLKMQSVTGANYVSNMVSYYQSAGDDKVQLANFSIDNFDVNTAYFSKRYSSTPVMILGAPSDNNSFSMTQRIDGVSTTSYRFFVSPWSYASGSQLTSPDRLATMALPAGPYDLGGLKAEAQKVAGVTRDWVTVEFGQTFNEAPVVFPTIISTANPYPLTVSVRNVTASGFEMRLKSEEAITAVLKGETVNYFAIEPGNGAIDGKRYTVGRNFNDAGISAESVEIPFDSSFSEPIMFAALLSDEDNFASTLRYSLKSDSTFTLTKQRESSGGESDMSLDQFGWMIMDLAADQPGIGTGVFERHNGEKVDFYPNPATNVLHFRFNEPRMVEILDLAGNIHLKSFVSHTIDIAPLASGMYIVKVQGKLPGKLIVKK